MKVCQEISKRVDWLADEIAQSISLFNVREVVTDKHFANVNALNVTKNVWNRLFAFIHLAH